MPQTTNSRARSSSAAVAVGTQPKSKWFKPNDLLDKIFEASVIIKGVEGVLEFLGGVALLIVGSGAILGLTQRLVSGELAENPHNLFANFILHSGQQLASGGTTYLVLYLFIHALIKFVAVYGLLRNKLWSYPFSLATLGLFMAYQIYQVSLSHSLLIALLTLYDVFLLWLIWREYKIQERKQRAYNQT